ncbi:hypothetical protein V8D89_004058 [Ganoderma adspersum]
MALGQARIGKVEERPRERECHIGTGRRRGEAQVAGTPSHRPQCHRPTGSRAHSAIVWVLSRLGAFPSVRRASTEEQLTWSAVCVDASGWVSGWSRPPRGRVLLELVHRLFLHPRFHTLHTRATPSSSFASQGSADRFRARVAAPSRARPIPLEPPGRVENLADGRVSRTPCVSGVCCCACPSRVRPRHSRRPCLCFCTRLPLPPFVASFAVSPVSHGRLVSSSLNGHVSSRFVLSRVPVAAFHVNVLCSSISLPLPLLYLVVCLRTKYVLYCCVAN